MYDKDPLSKPELVEHMFKRISQQTDLSKVFQIKRQGKDRSDVFWLLGKVHGLENIAFCDSADLATVNGNPAKLQVLVNQIEQQKIPGYSSNEAVNSDLQDALKQYKATIEKMNLYPSDKKKLLALPFYMAKRNEAPRPSQGQDGQLNIFKELTGTDWNEHEFLEQDKETKITEFDYENYLNQDLLKNADTNSKEFKNLVRHLNYATKTRYEAH